MNLRLNVQLTPEDSFEAANLNGAWGKYRSALTACITCAWVLFFAGGNTFRGGMAPVPLVIGITVGIGYFVFLSWYLRIRTAKLFAQQKSLHQTYDIELTDSHASMKSEQSYGAMPWGDFCKWNANEKIILLYPAENLYHLFPVRCFPSVQEFKTFQTFLAEKVGPKGKLKKRPEKLS